MTFEIYIRKPHLKHLMRRGKIGTRKKSISHCKNYNSSELFACYIFVINKLKGKLAHHIDDIISVLKQPIIIPAMEFDEHENNLEQKFYLNGLYGAY